MRAYLLSMFNDYFIVAKSLGLVYNDAKVKSKKAVKGEHSI